MKNRSLLVACSLAAVAVVGCRPTPMSRVMQDPIVKSSCPQTLAPLNLVADAQFNGSRRVLMSQLKYTISLRSEAALQWANGSGSLKTVSRLVNATANKFAGKVREEASGQVEASNGTRSFKVLTPEVLAGVVNATGITGYENTGCGLLFISQLQVDTDDRTRTRVQFSPGIPYIVNAAAGVETALREINGRREFAGIRVKVVESNNPNLPQGAEFVGKSVVTGDPETGEFRIENAFDVPNVQYYGWMGSFAWMRAKMDPNGGNKLELVEYPIINDGRVASSTLFKPAQ